ncbi:MAG TPA: S9 family peptidase [Micromonosporaceae bacterium]|nr:S9 family peptidase [Micromonosporaceae bacterium]
MKPTQIASARYIGAPTVHPNGSAAVVAVRRIDPDADDYTSQLWLVPTDGSPSRQLTHAWRDGSPTYSPDGNWIAFLRAERDAAGKVGKPQIWVMPTAGGEARKLTDQKLGADAPVWSHDSTRLAYVSREPEEGRYGTVEKTSPEKEPPRRLTKMRYRVDGVGYLFDRPRQIWVVALDGEPQQITSGDIDHGDVAWSPSDDQLVFAAAGHDNRGNDLRNDLWVCKPDGTDRRAVTNGGLSVGSPKFTPDGVSIVFLGSAIGPTAMTGVALNTSLWRIPAAGGEATRITDEETYNFAHGDSGLVLTPSGVLFLNEHRGAVDVLVVPFHGGEPTVLMEGRRQVQAVDAATTSAGLVLVATVADAQTWGDVVVRRADGTERVLTDWSADFRADATIFPLTEVNAPAPDGYPVHGWLVKPAGDGPHPLLLMIHGGPFTQYGWQLFDEAQVYAGAGYAVLYTNPRGSSGYGQAHGRAVIGNVGEVSTIDLMAILDATLAAHPDLDGSRMGVLGGSHGGFMTTWLAGHEGHRFRTAISERAVNAIDSFTGSSDIGWFFGNDLYGTDVEQQRRQSPLTYVDNIKIPMLIIHSEQDWRCPIEQGQRLYVALRHRGVPAEMLVFPGEGHELSRGGLPSHRMARFDAIIEWFGRHV